VCSFFVLKNNQKIQIILTIIRKFLYNKNGNKFSLDGNIKRW
jgi:hypothetical protein